MWAATFRREVILYTRSVPEKHQAWEISGNFSAGNRLTFEMTTGEYWFAEPSYPGSEFTFNALLIDISIIDPNGGKTNLTAVFAEMVGATDLFPKFKFFGAKLMSNDGGLNMEKKNILVEKNGTAYYSPIGGIVKYDGIYKVAVNREQPSPPNTLKLSKQEIEFEWLYLFVIPIGGTVMGSGITLSAWATRKRKHGIGQKIRNYK